MNIGFTTGDINGIGLEVLFKSLLNNTLWFQEHTFFIVSNSALLSHLIDRYYSDLCSVYGDTILLKQNPTCSIKIVEIKHPDVLQLAKEIRQNDVVFTFGEKSCVVGNVALNSVIETTKYAIAKQFDAIVTLPVSKSAIHLYSNKFIGHTEIITELCSKKQSLMVLFAENVRVALATIHTPIHKISKQITAKKLRTLCKNFQQTLKYDFRIKNPLIAVLSLNPHASDNGMFGKEEANIILPTIAVMQKKGLQIAGAFAADGFFASKNYNNFDGIIAMYHDQGLIPLKMIGNGGGVNFTANLPIIRTSPDHGTAFEIAGKNIANPQSMTDAINAAISIAKNRKW